MGLPRDSTSGLGPMGPGLTPVAGYAKPLRRGSLRGTFLGARAVRMDLRVTSSLRRELVGQSNTIGHVIPFCFMDALRPRRSIEAPTIFYHGPASGFQSRNRL